MSMMLGNVRNWVNLTTYVTQIASFQALDKKHYETGFGEETSHACIVPSLHDCDACLLRG